MVPHHEWDLLMNKQQLLIASLIDRLDPTSGRPINESMVGGMSSFMAGGSESTPVDSYADGPELAEPTDGDQGFSEQELKIAKRFIELVGGVDRAKEILDKVDECEDCLELLEDDDDDATIAQVAGTIPSSPDLPTGLSSLYNPSAGGPQFT